MNYELIFDKKHHYLTTPQRSHRRLCYGNEHILKSIKNQKEDEDLFITKYSDDNVVLCIILDFDNKDNPQLAYRDAKYLKRITAKNGLNTVIVRSGSKGYHTYTQIPPLCFRSDVPGVDSHLWFDKFVSKVTNHKLKSKRHVYKTLDSTNTGAGLKGNIRVIGSIHPKTQKRCEIIEGEFKEIYLPNQFVWDSFNETMNAAENSVAYKTKKVEAKIREMRRQNKTNSTPEHDLRTLMPSIYGGKTKTFSDYIMMQCPFHNDNNPSMKVKKEFYYCLGCGATGNWWSLRDLGVVDFEYIRVGKNKKKSEV